MRRSESMTANGPLDFKTSSPLVPPTAVSTEYRLRNVRVSPSRTFSSSSTQRMRGRTSAMSNSLRLVRKLFRHLVPLWQLLGDVWQRENLRVDCRLDERSSTGSLARVLVGEQVRNIDNRYHVYMTLRDPLRMMMVCDGLDDRVGESPQTEQIRPRFGMRNAAEFLFDGKQGPLLELRTGEGAGEVIRSSFSDDQLPDVV